MEGWFESVVIEVEKGDRFALRWRDWPKEPTVARYRWQLGLLSPGHGV
jgi:hypothetical protein